MRETEGVLVKYLAFLDNEHIAVETGVSFAPENILDLRDFLRHRGIGIPYRDRIKVFNRFARHGHVRGISVVFSN
ncbi:hypothetical protein D3C87_1978200 [compost metagenome]